MSKTLTIREIWIPTDAEIEEIRGLSSGEIWKDYDNLYSLFEEEYTEESELHDKMIKIETIDNKTLYVAKSNLLNISSDELLASLVIETMPEYTNSTYRDISHLFGQTLSGSTTYWGKNYSTNQVVQKTRKVHLQLPEQSDGHHLIFFYDRG